MTIPNCCGTCTRLGACDKTEGLTAAEFYGPHPCWIQPPPDEGPDFYDAGVEADRQMEAEEARETWERERRERSIR